MSIDDIAARAGHEARQALHGTVDVDQALAAVTSGRTRKVRAPLVIALVVAVIVSPVLVWALVVVTRAPAEPSPVGPAPSPSAPLPTPTSEPSPNQEPETVASPDPASYVEVSNASKDRLPRSIREIPGVENFQASPDGTQLAFYGNGAIYVSDLDGRQLRRLCPSPYEAAPSWTPDGGGLVFNADRELRLVQVETGEVHVLRTFRETVWVPRVSPDGTTVLFTMMQASQERQRFALWTMPLQGGPVTLLRPSAAFGTYSPDGTVIAFRRTDFGSADAGTATRMTAYGVSLMGTDGTDLGWACGGDGGWMSQITPGALWPAWSPDGRRLAYERSVRAESAQICEVDSGREVTVRAKSTHPTWLDNDTLIIERPLDKVVYVPD